MRMVIAVALATATALPSFTTMARADDYEDGVRFYLVRDYPQAAISFRKAAERGDVKAQVNTGTMYLHGQGVARDDKEAFPWMSKAAEGGSAVAQTNLGPPPKASPTRKTTSA